MWFSVGEIYETERDTLEFKKIQASYGYAKNIILLESGGWVKSTATRRLNGLDLFSGIGGIAFALQDYVCPVAYCEIEMYCQAVLLQRQAEGKLERAPIWGDIQTLSGSDLPDIDIIYGGFPCQDISAAGRGEGLAGKRSGLFWEFHRLVKEIKPTFVFLENVPAIRTRGLDAVVRSLTEIGYDSRWTMLSASSLGAPHIRERWFLLAYSNSEFVWDTKVNWVEQYTSFTGDNGEKEHMADSTSQRSQGNGCVRTQSKDYAGPFRKEWWKTEPDLGRVVDGLPFRVDRIKALGNAVVPAQAKKAFEILSGIDLKKEGAK